ncbi:hypothetical protein Taro_013538 [Colocasia esculenta]|uniref:Uncharacterized protein n=1 Tax=Colocasia esculenta TaxID=4460 RepID=A0A843UGQ8_COLES|nr:hypothetical protein [Colocasia esculenta]
MHKYTPNPLMADPVALLGLLGREEEAIGGGIRGEKVAKRSTSLSLRMICLSILRLPCNSSQRLWFHLNNDFGSTSILLKQRLHLNIDFGRTSTSCETTTLLEQRLRFKQRFHLHIDFSTTTTSIKQRLCVKRRPAVEWVVVPFGKKEDLLHQIATKNLSHSERDRRWRCVQAAYPDRPVAFCERPCRILDVPCHVPYRGKSEDDVTHTNGTGLE